MQAVISGQAGVALLVEGDKLSSIHAGKTDEVVRRLDREIPYLFGDARDWQFLENVELSDVARELELATTKADAFHIALILLDPQLTHDTRREAAEELTELLEIEGVLEYVEAVLYSRPMPGDGDLPGALFCCTGRSESARQLLLRLRSVQGKIAAVYEAWNQILDSVFGSEQERQHALSTAVRAGLFRDLVQTLASGGSVDDFIVKGFISKNFSDSVRNHREILREWLSPLREHDGPVAVPAYLFELDEMDVGQMVYLELVTGRHLLGRLKRFDRFAVVIESEGKETLIYKHAIVTIAGRKGSSATNRRQVSSRSSRETKGRDP